MYLDWNATTPLRPEAEQAWLEAQRATWGNPASSHRLGQQARARGDQARRELAEALGAKPHEFIFTGSGTEAINLALHTALARSAEDVETGKESSGARRAVIASAIDHSAVLRGTERLAGTTLHLVPVDAGGRVDPDALVHTMQQQPAAVVCLQWANNELGTLQDLAHLLPLIRSTDPEAFILIDACQGMGKEPCQIHQWQALGADFIAASAHKFGGPRGVGILWHRVGLMIASQINGGRQQDDRRSGTEDLAGCARPWLPYRRHSEIRHPCAICCSTWWLAFVRPFRRWWNWLRMCRDWVIPSIWPALGSKRKPCMHG